MNSKRRKILKNRIFVREQILGQRFRFFRFFDFTTSNVYSFCLVDINGNLDTGLIRVHGPKTWPEIHDHGILTYNVHVKNKRERLNHVEK